MTEQMTIRERWIAALDMQPVDRLPFWPKLSDPFVKRQSAPYNTMGCEEILKLLGADYLVGMGGCFRNKREKCSAETHLENGLIVTLFQTPHGTLRSTSGFDADSGSTHPVEFPIKTIDDLAILAEYFRDITPEVDPAQVEHAQKWLKGPKPLPAMAGVGPSPFMSYLQDLAGIAEGQIMLMEHPTEVGELLEAMHSVHLRQMEIIAEHCPADFVLLTENTSTTLLSPEQYRTFSRPHIAQYAQALHNAGKRAVLHMCGHLKAILPDLADLPVSGFEAFTSPTVGNTTFLDGRASCPDKCLIGGTNAALWLEPAPKIIEELERHLGELPHHRGLVPSSAGMMPPACSVDTVQKVMEWLKAYPVRV